MKKLSMASMALAAIGIGFAGPAAAKAKIEVLHTFCTKADCTDGAAPQSPLVSDGKGNYFGTTSSGSTYNRGTVFELSFDGKQWRSTRLYAFCADVGCPNGDTPHGGLVIDTSGNLFGTTGEGGINSGGVIYKLTPNGKKWRYSVIYKFCSAANCTDGMTPQFTTLAYQGQSSGVPYDGTSPLFGTTASGGGGAASAAGVVFELTPKGKTWNEKVIYNFCSIKNCNDGGVPYVGVTIDGAGNLFGTTGGGGQFQKADNGGVLYELKPNGVHWKYSVLHAFCEDRSHDVCLDGNQPLAPPTLDASGDMFGATFRGGATDGGTVYEIPSGGKFAVLHSFCAKANCTDGTGPGPGSLMMDSTGNLFGATINGGASPDGGGMIYEVTGAKHTGFSALTSLSDKTGVQPYGALTIDESGDLFGLTQGGGKKAQGTFYRVTP